MILKQINLENFRHFTKASFNFNPFLTVIVGENARGKTNLLEAIFFSIFGEGFRETKEEELMRFGQAAGSVEAIFNEGDEQLSFAIHFRKQKEAIEKIYVLNGGKKRQNQYQAQATKVVLFSPEQINIISGSPKRRRKYLDRVISSYDVIYKKKLINYENALRQRNKILEIHSHPVKIKEEILFWDNYLEQQSVYITQKRSEYVVYLNQNKKIDKVFFFAKYLKNEFNRKKAEEIFELEKRYRKTLIGPQKDDLEIRLFDGLFEKNLAHFGSRSEQRLGIFWLKFNEIRHNEEFFGKKPILLLDDIFSELDTRNRKLIIDLIKKYQTVLTTADVELLKLIDVPKSIIKL